MKSSSKQKQRAVLILGFRHVASQIGEGLEKLGFRPLLEEDLRVSFPILGDSQYREKIRGAFQDFSAWLDKKKVPEGFAHRFVHPGASVWAEKPEFSIIAQEFGLTVIAPPNTVLALFGNKLTLLHEAEKIGIPNLVLSFDPMHSIREIERLMTQSRQHYPVVLKSIRGSGSFGVCVAYEPDELTTKLQLWIEQLRRRTGEVILMTERYLLDARHIIVPFVRTVDGTVKVFSSIDASLQSKFRKIMQVAPVQSVDLKVIKKLEEWTEKFANHCRFVGVGSLEFLVEDESAYLVDGLARLNNAFHLWEKVSGTSATAWQIWALDPRMMKAPPPIKPDPRAGVGMAFQLYAEDSLLMLPQPGVAQEVSKKTSWIFRQGRARIAEGKIYLSVEEGTRIGPSHSGFLGQLFIFSDGYKRAIHAATLAIDDLWIAGSLQTSERFLRELLDHSWVKEGIFCSGFVDEEFTPAVRPDSFLYQILGAVCGLIPEVKNLPPQEARWAVGDQWVAQPQDVKKLIKWKKGPYFFRVKNGDAQSLPRGISGFIKLDKGKSIRICAYPLSPLPEGRWMLRAGNWFFIVRRVVKVQVHQSGRNERPARKPRVLALVSGRVHAVLFRDGTLVPAHEPFMIVESLGKLIPHSSPLDFQVIRWKVKAEDEVTVGEDLAEIMLPGAPSDSL